MTLLKMDHVIKSFNAAIKAGKSKCDAIRICVQEYIDIPRSVMQQTLVEGCKLNPATVRTQTQLARKSLGIVDVPAPKPAPAAVPAKAAKAVQKKAGASK